MIHGDPVAQFLAPPSSRMGELCSSKTFVAYRNLPIS